MFTHLLTLALRGLWRHRVATALNLLALMLGLLGFLFVGSKVVEVRGADSLWPHAERIVRLTQQTIPADTGNPSPVGPSVSFELEKYLKAELPGIDGVARARGMGSHPLLHGGKHVFSNIQAMDEDFSKIFIWPLREGDWNEALAHPRSIVLDQSVAKILFGDESPLGKTVTLNKIDLTVTGVLGDFPKQISLFDTKDGALVSRDIGEQMDYHKPDLPGNWLEPWTPTFALLPKGWDVARFNKALEGFGDRHVAKELATVRFGAVSLSKAIDLLENAFVQSASTGLTFAGLMWGMGGMVLIVACLNYANLSAAIAVARTREMALRKLLGEGFWPILAQGMIETALLACAAALLLLIFLILAAPILEGVPLMSDIHWLFHLRGFWVLGGIGLFAAIAAGGLFPALLLARSHPLSVIKSNPGGVWKRVSTILIALQFFAASLLLVAGLIAHDQNSFMQYLHAPRNQDKLYALRDTEDRTFRDVKNSVAGIPGVVAVSGRMGPFPAQGSISLSRLREGGARIQVFRDDVGPDFFRTIGTRIIAGRDFSPEHAEDLAASDDKKNITPGHVVIDRTLAERLGWSPAAAIGQTLFEINHDWSWQVTVIGVVEDRPVEAMVFDGSRGTVYQFQGDDVWFPIFRIAHENEAATAALLVAALNDMAPDRPARIASEAQLYSGMEEQLRSIPFLFDGLALFTFGIAIVGLTGMALQVIGQRRHEIGIRKTLGASDGRILRMLLIAFGRPVVIASLASWPLSYLAGQGYLSLYVKHEELTVRPFLISLGACFTVAALAVCFQTLRAARQNPADILRYE